MTIILSIPIFILTLMSALAGPAPAGETIDLSTIRSIVITGDASAIEITTSAEEPYRASVSGRRSGWFSSWYSSWFYNSCNDRSRFGIEGTTLTIDVALSAWSDIADCAPHLSANIPAGVAVRIEQEAFSADLDGDFSSFATTTNAADITLNGHASAVDISGSAVRANLSYARVLRDEKVAITAQSLDAFVGFGKDVPVDYTVTAKASYVDSLVPSVPGSRPLVNIRGDFVRVRIR
ncbi:hypothetical protein [Rhizobium sp. BK251]|uniref:hypothetical protein n=1 Tax=Rhizobium sp. BK251 TaxID=2512125 RepID=UPI001049D4C2|nr:hypothetical protein [Rhizobium sp. BK251]TCL69730.1 hypothetical protein EV286_108305 [Rhizobium sp. BK251]